MEENLNLDQSAVSSQNKKQGIALVILFIVLGVLVFVTVLFLTGLNSKIGLNFVRIPIPYDTPPVYRASFVYVFNTKVEALEEKNGKTILKTEVNGQSPEFVIDEGTKIALVENGKDFFTKKDILQPGTPVYVYSSYNLETKKWSTTRVAVVKSN